ncbi:MAG: hypothetical protein ACTSW1_14415 [Candidatus Hodarchaeales archaeon]
MARLTAYQVQSDGNFDPVPFKKTKLKAKEVFILVNEEKKEEWIWIGDGADVRTRFISSTVAQEIRRLYGLTFRVHSVDQGSEPKEFWECIDSIPKEGLGPTNSNTLDLSKGSSNVTSKSSAKKTVKKTKRATRGRPRKSTTKKQATSKKQATLNNFKPGKTDVITTPLCPRCKEGNLLPYSELIGNNIITFAKWQCSNCGFSPQNP